MSHKRSKGGLIKFLNRAFFQFYRFKELEGEREGKKKNRRNFSGLETKWDGGGGKEETRGEDYLGRWIWDQIVGC